MNMKKELNKWKIEEPSIEEMQATFTLCKTYLHKEEKREYMQMKQIFRILCKTQKKWFVLEMLLGVLAFLFCQTVIEDYRLYFLSFTSILFAGLMMMESLKNLEYNVWELENSCVITTKKILIYKMVLMASMSLLLLFFLSLQTTILTSYNFLTVFSYGAFPFFLTSAFLFDLSARFKSHASFIVGFLTSNVVSYLLVTTLLESTIGNYVSVVMLVSVFYGFKMVKHYVKTIEKEGGGLLWN